MRPGIPSQDRGSRERALITQADHLKPSTRSDENIELRQTSTAGKTIGDQGQAKLSLRESAISNELFLN